MLKIVLAFLVWCLGSDDFRTRESAEWALSCYCLATEDRSPARAAMASGDAEVRHRGRRVMHRYYAVQPFFGSYPPIDRVPAEHAHDGDYELLKQQSDNHFDWNSRDYVKRMASREYARVLMDRGYTRWRARWVFDRVLLRNAYQELRPLSNVAPFNLLFALARQPVYRQGG